MRNSKLSSWFAVAGLWLFLLGVFLLVWESGFHAGRPAQPGGAVQVEVVTSGAAAMPTVTIAPGSCSAAATVPAPGAASTDTLVTGFTSDPNSVRGYAGLTLFSWPSPDAVNFKLCNVTGAAITPGPESVNWRIARNGWMWSIVP